MMTFSMDDGCRPIVDDLKKLFSFLDHTEETSEGFVRPAVQILCSRADMTKELDKTLKRLRAHVK